MSNIKHEEFKIKKLFEIWKKFDFNLSYQRDDDAWSLKVKKKFIDSILNDFFIPSIIVNNNTTTDRYEVLDGKQRLNTINEFKKGNFKYTDSNNNQYSYDDVKDYFLEKELPISILQNENPDKLRETFLRINKGSISLNKNEFVFANMDSDVKGWIIDTSKNNDFRNICSSRIIDKRFAWESYIMWTLAIILNNKKDASVRNLTEKIFVENIFKKYEYEKVELTNNYEKVFKLINELQKVNPNIIPSKSFKTIFTSIFIALYRNISYYNSLFHNKEKIVEDLLEKIEDISLDQMGGGTKYDGMRHIQKRIDIVNQVITNYINIDSRRFDINLREKALMNQNWQCALCATKISLDTSHADHIKPYSKGGKTTIDNLQMLCPNCNLRKSNKY